MVGSFAHDDQVLAAQVRNDHFDSPADRFAHDLGPRSDQAHDSALEPCAAVHPSRLTISFRTSRAMVGQLFTTFLYAGLSLPLNL